jgi:hypothetical protein
MTTPPPPDKHREANLRAALRFLKLRAKAPELTLPPLARLVLRYRSPGCRYRVSLSHIAKANGGLPSRRTDVRARWIWRGANVLASGAGCGMGGGGTRLVGGTTASVEVPGCATQRVRLRFRRLTSAFRVDVPAGVETPVSGLVPTRTGDGQFPCQ